jgi:hypothetical protein
VWKRLKLLTLAVLTALLTITTYPTWSSLLSKSTAITWGPEDLVWISLPEPNILNAHLEVSSRLDSETTRTPQDRYIHNYTRIELTLERSVAPTTDPQIMHIEGAGKAQPLIDYCVHDVAANRRAEVKRGTATGYDLDLNDFAWKDNQMFFQCNLDPASLWSTSEARQLFSTPEIIMSTDNPASPMVSGSASANGPGTSCISISTRWNAGVFPGDHTKVDYLNDGDSSGAFSDEWGNCTRFDPVKSEQIEIDSVAADYIDILKRDSITRNLFVSGVFAGILGALAIEIFNGTYGTFDVAEHWSARRRTRRDEQEQRPEPEPTPDPPPPPDDEVDRDQLPLF